MSRTATPQLGREGNHDSGNRQGVTAPDPLLKSGRVGKGSLILAAVGRTRGLSSTGVPRKRFEGRSG